jgi:threonine/homoserine/homoserine lactone efflux protein
MLGIHDFTLFVIAGLLLNITPGPDMLYVIGRSTAQGTRAGAAAALGIGAGCFVHIAAAALGLSAILSASATAFTIVKVMGAAYLVYVGLSLLWSLRRTAISSDAAMLKPVSLRSVFTQGFLTNALNPKVALFFLAFVPQFIDVSSPHASLAFLLLGLVFNFTGTLWNLLVAWFAARTIGGLKTTRFAAWLNGCVGAVFVYLGVRLAFAKQA